MVKIKNISYSFVSNVLVSFSQWIILSFISKKYGTEYLGGYSLVISYLLPLYSFLSFQLRNIYISRKVQTSDEYSNFFYLRITTSTLFFLISLFIGYFFYIEYFFIFLIIGTAKLIEGVNDIIYAYYHKKSEIVIYSKSLIRRSIILGIVSFLFFNLFDEFLISLISIPLSYLVVLLVDLYKYPDFNLLKINKAKINSIFSLFNTGIFAGFSLFIIYLIPNFPRIILENYTSTFQLGIFSGYMYIVIISRVLVQSIVQNSIPILSKKFIDKEKTSFLKIVKKELLILFAIGLLQFSILPFKDFIFPILFNDDFIGNTKLLIVIFTGSIFSFLSFGVNNAINAMGDFKIQVFIYLIVLSVTVISSFLLIPAYSLLGAGFVYLISSFIQFLTLVLFFKYRFEKRI
ncbi:lipopolysaccharide biosynthesis protein [Cyclobacterium jeungdonense]|uniref:Lipopolysaccharide biosynthesis protein n=1 Tax=Cyclobacterium jeungdonense TaxID=708087 RepID=A0ABT8C9K5_9BACT|nr:lipopolysaccharide biosynthesis protein [Cyclobacterium jeungdonense]MDN3689484.1 lipopolysaccharide biosynthesis protein [Cyclobacterium jeungdonense]